MVLKNIYRIVIPAVLLLCSLPVVSFASDKADGDSIYSFRHKGLERYYRIFVPDSLAEGKPLVMMLHGYGGKPSPDRFRMREEASKHGFAVCYPQGHPDGRGKSCWNVGYPFQDDLKTDDVDFICRLACHIASEYGLCQDNIFCCGHSNGGEMCYLMAYVKPDFFAAVAPLAGLTLEWMYRELEASSPVPLLEIHGTDDRTSLWEGDPLNEGGWGAYISVPAAVGYWVAANRCTHALTEILPAKENGRKVIVHRYLGGTAGAEVWLYEIQGGSHSLPDTDLDTGMEVLEFFSRYIKKNDN